METFRTERIFLLHEELKSIERFLSFRPPLPDLQDKTLTAEQLEDAKKCEVLVKQIDKTQHERKDNILEELELLKDDSKEGLKKQVEFYEKMLKKIQNQNKGVQ